MFSSLAQIYNDFIFVTANGGWIIFAWGLLYMFYLLYMDYIQLTWYNQQKFVFVKVVAPKENEKSPLAFEQIFNQLHATHATYTFAEKYIEGQFQIWVTWEIVSIGGDIANYVRIQEKHRDTLEAAIYSHYPGAEISEAEDYLAKLPKFYPGESPYDIFAFNMILKKTDAYPIRTFLDFEHSSAETFVDPVDGIWEGLGKLSPYEMFVIQFMLRPVSDEWKESGFKLVKELKGEPEEKTGGGLAGVLINVIGAVTGPILDIFIRATPAEGQRSVAKEEYEPPSLMLHKSEGERAVITAVERNLTKLGYSTKIHCLYAAPREKFNPGQAYTAVIGAFKSLASTYLNAIKPDTDHWTKVKYFLFKDWEKPISMKRLQYRQRRFFYRITHRWFFHGPHPYVLNTEELATMIHFPRTEVKVPAVQKVPTAKVQPPPELPIVI